MLVLVLVYIVMGWDAALSIEGRREGANELYKFICMIEREREREREREKERDLLRR